MQSIAAIFVMTLPATWLLIGGAIYRPRRDGRLGPPLLRAIGYDVTAIAAGVAVAGFIVRPDPLWGSPGPILGVMLGVIGGLVLFTFLARDWPPSPVSIVRAQPRRLAVQGSITSLTSIAEEVAWRGVALGTAITVWGWPAPVAVIVTATLFGSLHLGLGGWRAVATHTLTGFLLGGAFVVTGQLIASIAAHVAYNLVVIAYRLTQRTAVTQNDGIPVP
jgi:membrane protease YdiL (CAAX protease family)